MRTNYATLEEFITTETSMDGNTYRVITYNGEKFAEPYLHLANLQSTIICVLIRLQSNNKKIVFATPTKLL